MMVGSGEKEEEFKEVRKRKGQSKICQVWQYCCLMEMDMFI